MSPSSSTDTRVASSPVDGPGLTISDGEYAAKVQKLIQLIDDLRALGAEAVIDLPGIAVIGNQSAGKSSLVEALSAISVPRNANTCTRCPMECRLKHSLKPWTCQVRLRRKCDTDLDGHHSKRFEPNGDADGNKKQNAREEYFGPVLTDKSELELMIRRAQLAVLNPNLPLSRFVGMSEKELEDGFAGNDGQLQFSEDVVCLDITGPDATNLSFIDLPGIISFDDKDNVTLVENMVKHHIKGNALILLTITMREDIQLQGAAGLAKEADPLGLRTIGVLTKPDTLQEGEEDAWVDILSAKGPLGSKYKLHHGYFVTKQPALAELKEKMGHKEARERERAFFESTAPWNTLPSRVRARMGVPKLTLDLSRLLSQLIEKSLPDLRKEASRSLSETQTALDALPPPPPENPVIELSRLLTAFTNEFNRYVWGATGYEEVSQHCRRTYTTFTKDILSTRPNFAPKAMPQKSLLKLNSDVDITRSGLAFEIIEEAKGIPCNSKPMYLDELHEFLEGSLTRELPYNVPFPAKAKLIRDCFAEWDKYCIKCFDAVKDTLRARILALVGRHFARYTRGGLEDQVRRIVESELDRCYRATKERIKWLLELEDPPFTKNDHYFASYRETYLAQYKESRRLSQRKLTPPSSTPFNTSEPSSSLFSFATPPVRKAKEPLTPPFAYAPAPAPASAATTNHEDDVNEVLARLARLGYTGKKEEDLAKLNDSDPFEQELIVMAEVSAYFRVAYKRIIDNVPRVIDHDFLCALDKSLHEALNKGLGVGERDAYDRAENYLRDEPGVVAEREELGRKKERLEEIVERLGRFYV